MVPSLSLSNDGMVEPHKKNHAIRSGKGRFETVGENPAPFGVTLFQQLRLKQVRRCSAICSAFWQGDAWRLPIR